MKITFHRDKSDQCDSYSVWLVPPYRCTYTSPRSADEAQSSDIDPHLNREDKPDAYACGTTGVYVLGISMVHTPL